MSSVEFPELVVHNIRGMRFYEAPDGNKYPSITTVLSKQPGKQKGLQAWRERIGEEQARLVSGKAARRGTAFHNICEDYLNGVEDITHHKDKNFLAYCMFGEMKSHLDEKIDKVVLQEQTMYSPKYQVAGRCDFIGVYNNTLAVVDFKTTTTPKKEEWIEDHFIQCTAYASMFEEHTGEAIENIVIMMVAEDGQVQIFEKKTSDYFSKLAMTMDNFYNNLDVDALVA
jgi:CRISPR/Cas system-associated exonuclease Cas4 (RecB family)